APDHRIELAGARLRGQIAGILLERIIAVLGARALRGAALAHLADRGVQSLRRRAGILQDAAGPAIAGHRERQQQPFGCDVPIAAPAVSATVSAWSRKRASSGAM